VVGERVEPGEWSGRQRAPEMGWASKRNGVRAQRRVNARTCRGAVVKEGGSGNARLPHRGGERQCPSRKARPGKVQERQGMGKVKHGRTNRGGGIFWETNRGGMEGVRRSRTKGNKRASCLSNRQNGSQVSLCIVEGARVRRRPSECCPIPGPVRRWRCAGRW